MVRSQLISAPLLVTQCGVQNLLSTLETGDRQLLDRLRLGDTAPVVDTLKCLSRAPPLLVLKLLDKVKGNLVGNLLANVSAELDFFQSVSYLVSSGDGLNPALNAVADAFRRPHLKGRFVAENENVRMSALMYADTNGEEDHDFAATDIKERYSPKKSNTRRQVKSSRGICFLFQENKCRWSDCRFEHRCARCYSWAHGEVNCMDKGRSSKGSRSDGKSNRQPKRNKEAEVPPHPRFRRDRPE